MDFRCRLQIHMSNSLRLSRILTYVQILEVFKDSRNLVNHLDSLWYRVPHQINWDYVCYCYWKISWLFNVTKNLKLFRQTHWAEYFKYNCLLLSTDCMSLYHFQIVNFGKCLKYLVCIFLLPYNLNIQNICTCIYVYE